MLHARRRQNAAGPYYPRLKIPGLRRRIRVSAAMGWQRPPGFAPRPPQEPVGPSPPRLRPDCYLARPMAASEPRAAVLPDVSLAVTFRARLLPAFYITCFFDAVLVAYARRAAHSHWQNCKATGSDGNIDGGRGA